MQCKNVSNVQLRTIVKGISLDKQSSIIIIRVRYETTTQSFNPSQYFCT